MEKDILRKRGLNMRGYGRKDHYERRGKTFRRVGTVIAVLIVAFALAGAQTTGPGSEAATVYQYTGKCYGGTEGTLFTVPGLKLTGVCCQAGVETKNGVATIVKLSNGSSHAKVAYYWGVVKGYDKKDIKSNERMKLTRMSQYISSPKSVSKYSYVKSGQCKKDIDIALKVKVPDTFLIYKGNPTNNSQDFIAWRNMTPSSVTLKKTSTDPTFSKSGNYSFAGISYRVYKADKKTSVGVLYCKADGTTNTITGLPKGTYYAIERHSNSYYAYSDQWLSVTVGEGGKGTFIAKDKPLKGKVMLNKGSTDSNSIKAGYSFSGIQYGVYASRSTSSKLLAKLTLDDSGKSNVSGDIPVGTRYIREIKTNAYYKLSETWYPVVIKSGATVNLPSSQVKDEPVSGILELVKKISDGNKTDEVFTFELVNSMDPTLCYKDIKVKGDGIPVKLNILAGTYILRETDSGEYIDETGDQIIVIRADETNSIERINHMAKTGSLQLRKKTNDSGSREGFRFKVTGKLKNQGIISEEDIISLANPRIYSISDLGPYSVTGWKVDEEDVLALNGAAEEGRTGEYTATVRTTAQKSGAGGSGESISIEEKVKIKIEGTYWNSEKREYEDRKIDQKDVTSERGDCRVVLSEILWQGAATEYRDPDTGNNYSILVTDNRGYGMNEVTGEEGLKNILLGEYTVSEILSDEQKLLYEEPEPQTGTWSGQGEGAFVFEFLNIAKEPESPELRIRMKESTPPPEPTTEPEPTTVPESTTVPQKTTVPQTTTTPAPTPEPGTTTAPPDPEPVPKKNTRTGDDARNIWLMFVVFLTAAGAIAGTLASKRRSR